MKAERRHELKENTLAKKLVEIPDNSKQYGTRIAMGVILVALIAILIRYRMNSAAEKLANAQASLNDANISLIQLQEQMTSNIDDATIAKTRQTLYSDGLQAAATVIQDAPEKNAPLRAQALICQGDLNFTLANLPDLPGATTRPSLRPEISQSDLLSKAEDAYNLVIQTYPNEKQQWIAANFGLAAIAEDRAAPSNDASQWDKAKHFYQTIIESDPPAGFAKLASNRLDMLPQISQPVLTYVVPQSAALPGGGMLGPPSPASMLSPNGLPGSGLFDPTTIPSLGGGNFQMTPSSLMQGLPATTMPDLMLPGNPTTVPSDLNFHQPNSPLAPTTIPANP